MNRIFNKLLYVQFYLSDVIVHSTKMEEHVGSLETMCKLVSKDRLKSKVCKRFFLQSKISLLGHVLSAESISVHPRKSAALRNKNAVFSVT